MFKFIIIFFNLYYVILNANDGFDGILNETILYKWKIYNTSKVISVIDKNILQIEDDTFDQFKNLIRVELNSNFLESINENVFKTLDKLLLLNLNNNQLNSLNENAFSNLISIISIDLSFNNLTHIPGLLFKATTNLERLDLSYNKIEILNVIVFQNLVNLTNLNLNNNRIKTLDENLFQFLNKLLILELNSNRLEYLNQNQFSSLVNLKRLYLDYNFLSNLIYLNDLLNLNYISLNGNLINEISIQIRIENKLQEIHLGNNLIRVIRETSFVNFTQLNVVNLSSNRIVLMNKNAFKNSANNLKTIELGGNFLAHIYENKLDYLCSYSTDCTVYYN